jgi:hypothetical protein
MIPYNVESQIVFRQTPVQRSQGKPVDKTKDEIKESPPEDGEYIRCRQCLLIITQKSERIEVNGSHHHVNANPHGIVFEIGCFKTAVGCGTIGPSYNEWSWFPGYSWKVAVCRRCLIHLGWLFSSSAPNHFYGFILHRLIPT